MKAALRVFLINFCSGLFCDDRDRSDLFLLKMCSVPCENGPGSDISHELILNCIWEE